MVGASSLGLFARAHGRKSFDAESVDSNSLNNVD